MKRALKIVLFAVSAILLFALPPLIYEFSSYYHALENEVVARFSGKRWNIPSRIYSDSCFVYPGQSLDAMTGRAHPITMQFQQHGVGISDVHLVIDDQH